MSQLPIIKRFASEDFPDQASWIGKLFYPLNLFLTNVYSNLNNGLTLSQNLQTQVAILPVDGSDPVVTFPYKYSPLTPIGVTVMNVTQTDTPVVTLTSAVGVLWTYANGEITATVQGLDASSLYNVTFTVWGG